MKPLPDNSPVTDQMLSQAASTREQQFQTLIFAAIGISMLIVLLADLVTPLGVAVWIGFLLPVTLSLALLRPLAPILLGALTTVIMIYTFISDEPGLSPNIALMNRIFGILTIWIMAIVGYFFISNRLLVRHQQWLQQARAGLNDVVSGEQSPGQLGDNVLRFLCEYTRAEAGALYIRGLEHFEKVATYGVPAGAQIPESFTPDEGLLGQAAKDSRTFLLRDVPAGYLQAGSAFGREKPVSLLIAPMRADTSVNAVIELGYMRSVDQSVLALLDHVSEPLGIAVRSSGYRARLQQLLEETQLQAEELQAQGEELRVANEELQNRSRALEASHADLEEHQRVLEETNSQLEEQARQLEEQKDDLARTRNAIEHKAQELELASRYKSDFLANMSHELRTPLNSTLILARLLADNGEGNLTAEQVRSAETILSSGNDLLNLINDILDLSKIEAGRMDVRRESIWLEQMLKGLDSVMRPLAEQKSLAMQMSVGEDCPQSIETDGQRVEQILRNLLSNALKFTEKGQVSLQVQCDAEDTVSFVVTDTGIGIPEERQQDIFEAFHQVDSASNRRYGGTGLGLSISRELAHLLGGQIHLRSTPGQGSCFTLTLPKKYDPLLTETPRAPRPESLRPTARPPVSLKEIRISNEASTHNSLAAVTLRPSSVEDDRDTIEPGSRVILIVEDDQSFARILRDLAHEHGFKCLAAATAEDALALAFQHRPSAVVLDVGLPDQSGLVVLDRLKGDTHTRHIPVHVISANDYAETALSMGAVGYMLKPVTRDSLVETLQGLQATMSKSMHRVLVVEDDEVQRESACRLLQSKDVETVGATTGAEGLQALQTGNFDCLVLDLSLPDTSGLAFLQTISDSEEYPFPPVVIYTARDLTLDEEHQLRQLARSIIIKGPKSHERLLDEVTLFLHQVVSELPEPQQQMIRAARGREAVLEGRRILIVEDDVRNVFALSSVLEMRGAIISIARNGREALEALEKAGSANEKLDLVLMDVMMPEMDGLTATRAIRSQSRWQSLPIIMLTAKAMREDHDTCIQAGANDYMAKPLDVDKLLSLIHVWIRH